MKKTLFVLTLMLAWVITAQAQNLTRTAWSTMLPGEEEVELVLNFDNDGECYMILTHEEYDEDSEMIIRVSMSVPGIYNKEGQDLIISFNKKKADVNIDVDLSNVDPSMRSLMEKMLKPELKKMEKEVKAEMLEMVPAMLDNVKVVQVTPKVLVLGTDDGDTMTFYPTAKG
ncbi:MAG: hypothetical protein IKW83_03080 [Muribaculaceae bacterium]|nr:hypothetical protein [Muribaculaceae bacterium]